MIGLGPTAIGVLLNKKVALEDCKLVAPKIEDIVLCATGKDIEALTCLGQNGAVTFPGSATFILTPWLRESILNLEIIDPFELIKIALKEAKEFDEAHKDEPNTGGTEVEHAEDFSLWAYRVGKGLVKESRFSMKPDDAELKLYAKAR
eukprot:2255616-Ditylum_brightwellii.AAC.1